MGNRFAGFKKVPTVYKSYNGNAICNEVSLMEYLRTEGLLAGEPNRTGKVLCCFHADKEPSMQLYTFENGKAKDGKETCYCFSCGSGGDIISITQRLKGMSFGQACDYIVSTFNINEKAVIENYDEWKDAQDEIARRSAIKKLKQEGNIEQARELAKQSEYVAPDIHDFSTETFPLEHKEDELIGLRAFTKRIDNPNYNQTEYFNIKECMDAGMFSPEQIAYFETEGFDMYTEDERDCVAYSYSYGEPTISIPSMRDIWLNSDDGYERYSIEVMILEHCDEAIIEIVESLESEREVWRNYRKHYTAEEFARMNALLNAVEKYENDEEVRNGNKPRLVLSKDEQSKVLEARLIREVEIIGKQLNDNLNTIKNIKSRIETLWNERGEEWLKSVQEREIKDDLEAEERFRNTREESLRKRENMLEKLNISREANKQYVYEERLKRNPNYNKNRSKSIIEKI